MTNDIMPDLYEETTIYINGQHLFEDRHFLDHIEHEVPIQIYCEREHSDIGFIEQFSADYVKVNNVFYNRDQFTFISRPGY
ncbi:hypothetical protein [Paenibacillus darwinianus]|uniref:hypothetical protein n=1 Tax=Paenibacillus darwinianus TaxID=1380763 RepID=UPI000AC43056|nr:hypothetical protein [Paenibacillus darwinianus]